MKAAQIVGTHDPDKTYARAAAYQIRDSLIGVMAADLRLEVGDVNARMIGERPCGRHALRQRRQAARVLERIAGGDEPPDAIEAKPPHRQQAGGAMRRM